MPEPPEWQWVFVLAMLSAGLILASLVWTVAVKEKKRRLEKEAAQAPAVAIKRI